MANSQEQQVKLLKDYLQERNDVAFAFLFGSRARGYARSNSDWDIGVYLKPKSGRLEVETEQDYYDQRSDIWGDLIELLVTDDVDLLVLNATSVSTAASVLSGIELAINNRRLYLEFLLIATRQAEDFRRLVDEYYTTYWRSASLNLEDYKILQARLTFLEHELGDSERMSSFRQVDYQNDRDIRRSVERWVESLINATIDISKTMLASEKQTIPETYRRVIRSLSKLDLFSDDFARKLARWTDLRNILAHEYLDFRWRDIKSFMRTGIPLLEEFMKKAYSFLKNGKKSSKDR